MSGKFQTVSLELGAEITKEIDEISKDMKKMAVEDDLKRRKAAE